MRCVACEGSAFFLPKNIRKRGLLRYIVILIIICFKGFRFLMFSSTQPVRVGWNFKIEFISYKYTTLKYYFDFWNKLVFRDRNYCDMRCL